MVVFFLGVAGMFDEGCNVGTWVRCDVARRVKLDEAGNKRCI